MSLQLAGHLWKEKGEKFFVSLKFTARSDQVDLRTEFRIFGEILAGCSEPLYYATVVKYSAIISAEQAFSSTLLGFFHPNMTKIIAVK